MTVRIRTLRRYVDDDSLALCRVRCGQETQSLEPERLTGLSACYAVWKCKCIS